VIAWKLSGHCESTVATLGPPRYIRSSFKTRFGLFGKVGGSAPLGSGMTVTNVRRFGRERMRETKVPYVHTVC